MYSHFWYDAPTSRLASYYAKEVPVYLYSFDHVSENFETDRKLTTTISNFVFTFKSFLDFLLNMLSLIL